MPEFDSERLKKLIEAFKSAEEQVQTVLLNTKAESVEDYKFKVEKKLDKVSVSLMKESIEWAEKDLPKAYREGEKRTDTRLEGSHAVAFGKLSDAAIETPYIELARHTQYANDYQKEIIDKAITEAEKEGYGATVEKVKNIIQDTLAKDNASMIVQYSNGTKMPLDKYAEMLARTSRIETANKGSFDRCRKLGIDLVRCTKVPNCCPYCQMYEDKVYSISGNDTRFPALYETALQRGYDIMHPNCRHEFIPFIEEFYTDEEMQELIKNSNHFEELSPDNRIFKTYNKNQALLRQWNEERHEFNKMQAEYKARGEEPPYTTLGGFRRARRAESTEYKKLHYRDRDERLYENWKSVVGKENMPKTLDKFQEIRYNDEKEYRRIQTTVSDKRISDDIKGGKYSLKINDEKQAKHFLNSEKYKEGGSYLTITPEKCQKIVKDLAGTGIIERTKSGNFASKETVTLNENVGYVKDLSGEWIPTNKVKIHYSKSGVHIVPTLRGKRK
ncbi:MAG: hypothetical protein IJQ23_01410 [Clostridia bacterium]|nr:hypothetical protein [Clostridia bacterium]